MRARMPACAPDQSPAAYGYLWAPTIQHDDGRFMLVMWEERPQDCVSYDQSVPGTVNVDLNVVRVGTARAGPPRPHTAFLRTAFPR